MKKTSYLILIVFLLVLPFSIAFEIEYSTGTPTNNSNVTTNSFNIYVEGNDTISTCVAQLSPNSIERTLNIDSEADKDFELDIETGGTDTEHPLVGVYGYAYPYSENITTVAVIEMNTTTILNKNITAAEFLWRNENEDTDIALVNSSLLGVSLYYNSSANICKDNITFCLKVVNRSGVLLENYSTNGVDWHDTFGDWYSANISDHIMLDTDGVMIFYFVGNLTAPQYIQSILTIGDSKGEGWRSRINYTLYEDNISMTVSDLTASYENVGLTNNTYYNFKVFCNDTNDDWAETGSRVIFTSFQEEQEQSPSSEFRDTLTAQESLLFFFMVFLIIFGGIYAVIEDFAVGFLSIILGAIIAVHLLSPLIG